MAVERVERGCIYILIFKSINEEAEFAIILICYNFTDTISIFHVKAH